MNCRRTLYFVFTSTLAHSIILFATLFGTPSTNAAALVGNAPRIELTVHLDQQLEQNQTEAEPEPDLSQQPVAATTTLSPPATNSSHANKAGLSAIEIMKQTFGRQDVGQEVGERVGTIISGVLGGGIENVFTGSSSFIENPAAAEEVNFVLHNVAPPLESVLKYGYNGLKQYFGIGQTTVKTVVVTQPPEEHVFLQPVVFENGTVQYIPIYHTVTKAPEVVIVTNPPPETEDNDAKRLLVGEVVETAVEKDHNGLEDESVKSPVLERSRVDRLHLHIH